MTHKTMIVSVRFTSSEVDQLGKIARRLGWSRSKLIRVITQRFMIEHRDKDVAKVLIGQMND
jgi:metal-responsive CopG/Arc/MetJ family transcriptional regulator